MSFDYEAVTWGGGSVISPESPDFLDHSLHLRRALEALYGVSGSVLEIGCGSGRFIASIAAARPDLEAFGCDVSESALEAARHRRGIHFDRCGAEQLPYEDGQFGAVMMIDVLEHLEDMDRGLAEARRVLEPQGVFHLVFPCERNPFTLHRLFPVIQRLKQKHAGHLHHLSSRELLSRLQAQGLAPVDVRSSYHLIGQLYDALVFSALGLGIDMHQARHEWVESGKRSPLSVARHCLSRVLYAESTLFANTQWGMTLHVTCRKSEDQ